jgi:putative membrane protein
MRIRVKLSILLFGVVFLAASTGCQKSGVQAARENDLTSQKILSIDDQKFLDTAEKSQIRQNTLAQEAIQRSRNASIQAFATKVTNDMSVALTELKDLMKAKHMEEPAEFASEVHSESAERLRSVSDEGFDREFISLMAAEQQDAVRTFDSAAQTAADPDVRNYAKRVLPSLQADYDKVIDLQKKLAGKPAE